MEFLKQSELKLNEGNYLVSAVTGKPVTNSEFVAEQVKAHFLVTLAAKCKGKNFKAEAVESFANLVAETTKEVNSSTSTTYFEKVAEPKSKVLDDLIKTALAFHEVGTSNERADKLNALLQEYNSVNKVEKFGMYFTSEVVELSGLYTIEQIKAATEVVVDIRD